MSLRRGLPVLLDLALIQVGILLSYLARFGTGLLQHSEAGGLVSISEPSSALSSSSCSTSITSTLIQNTKIIWTSWIGGEGRLFGDST